jgi:hypothetical protein
MRYQSLVVSLAVCLMILAGTAPGGEVALGDLPPLIHPARVVVSPNAGRFAYIRPAMGRRKMTAVVDGKEEVGVDWIANNSIVFSADSKHYVYQAKSDLATWLVVDGVAGKEWERIEDWSMSPTGKLALAGSEKGKTVGIVDGKEQVAYEHLRIAAFPENGQVVWIGWNKAGECAMRGQKQGRVYGAVYDVRIDGGRVAYRALHDGRFMIVANGEEGRKYDEISGPVLAAGHVAYAARRGKVDVVVIDGAEGRPYEMGDLAAPILSADGKHWFYVGSRRGKAVAVVDGIEKAEWNWVGPARMFSADGKKLMYVAGRAEGGASVVVDGEAGPAYDAVSSAMMSKDGRVAYVAARGSWFIPVVDGKEMGQWDGIEPGGISFSPDGKRVAWMGRRGEKSVLVVDGKEIGEIDEVLGGGKVGWDEKGHARCLGAKKEEKGWRVVRVEG